MKHSFRFADPALNRELLTRARKARIAFSACREGGICYSANDEARVEDEVLGPIRDQLFPSWQLVFCPPDWAERYRTYMRGHGVRFEEQWLGERPCFLIPRAHRPHQWKLPDERRNVVARRLVSKA